VRIQKLIYSMLVLISFTLCPSLKGDILNPACSASNCKTDKGILECLGTGYFGHFFSDTRFFHQNENNQSVYRTISVVVEVKNTPIDNGTPKGDFYTQPVKILKVIALVSSAAHKAFLKTINENPHCLRTFCHANCLKVSALSSKAIKAQSKIFSNAIVPLTIQGKTYSPSELKDLDKEKRKLLAIAYLLEARGSILSACCLGEDMSSITLRMICSQCPKVLDKTNSDLNVTCASFNAPQNVAYDQQPQDSDPQLQAQMAATIAAQDALVQKAIGNRNNPAASADLNHLTDQLNALYGN
jgi:hypothetical protein